MEEIEVPTEHLHEEMHHQAHQSGESWVMGVALTSALLAVLAAITALQAGHHANEAVIEQVKASDAWNMFQAKGIKKSLMETRIETVSALGHKPKEADIEKLKSYEEEKIEIKKDAEEKESQAKVHLHTHMILAKGVTLFQVAIAVSAISVLTKKRLFWFVSLAFGGVGAFFLIQGLLI